MATITLIKSKLLDDDYAIDATHATSTQKSICLVWHGAAPGTLPGPLTSGATYSGVSALRCRVVTRSASSTDSHLVVSQAIFNSMRAALITSNLRLTLTFNDGDPSFSISCSAALVEAAPPDPYLQTISQTVQETNDKVAQLQSDVGEIKQLLHDFLRGRTPAMLENGHLNRYEEYTSEGGAAQS